MKNDKLYWELYGAILMKTKHKSFSEKMCLRLSKDNEKEELLNFINENKNCDMSSINKKAIEIIAPRWGITI